MIWRYSLAFVLSVAVLWGWQFWMAGKARDEEPKQPSEAVDAGSAEPGSGTGGSAETGGGNGTAVGRNDRDGGQTTTKGGDRPTSARVPGARVPGARVPGAGGPGVAITWRDGSASIGRLSIVEDGTSREVLDSTGSDAGPLDLSVETRGGSGAGLEEWGAESLSGWVVDPESLDSGPWIHRVSGGGLQVTRHVSEIAGAGGSGRTLRVQLTFENPGDSAVTMRYRMRGPGGLVSALADRSGRDLFVARGVRGTGGRLEVQTLTATDVVGTPWITADTPLWAASANAELIAVCWPDSAVDGVSRPLDRLVVEAAAGDRDGARVLSTSTALEGRAVPISAGGRHIEELLLYIGPRDPEALARDAPDGGKLYLARANQIDVDFAGTLRLTIDSATGSIDSIYLLRYFVDPASVEPRVPYQLLVEPPDGVGFLNLEKSGEGAGKWKSAWAMSTGRLADGREEVVLEKTVDNVRVRKRIAVAAPADVEGAVSGELFELADGQLLQVSLELENVAGSGAEDFEYILYGPTAIAASSRRSPGYFIEYGFGLHSESGRVLTDVESVPAYDEAKPQNSEKPFQNKPVAWLAVMNSYFTALLFPVARDSVDNLHAEAVPYSASEGSARILTVRTWMQRHERLLAGAPARRVSFGVYLGPRKSDFLEDDTELQLQGVNDYGMFSSLVHLFMSLLGFLGSIFPVENPWGLAIISLTIVVKLCLHPINRKSQRSMMRFQKKMGKIQPQMKELQAEFGSDRARYSQEVQKLWKTHGVNPGQGMMSCLVMFLQLPIWIGLYRSLEYAIDLRQAPFLYIVDLTEQDRLIPDIGFTIPFLGNSFNLLPILYVILTLANQRLQPRPTDPQMQSQYKMMTFMMIFFGFIFYSFPAGFMLYIMTSSALGIIESKIIKAQIAAEDAASEGAPAEPVTVGLGGAPVGGGGTSPGRRHAQRERDGGKGSGARGKRRKRR